MAFCTLFYTLQSKEEGEGGYMKSIGDIREVGEKANGGPLGLDKK